MTEADIRSALASFPGVNIRALTHVIEGAAAEAAAGLVATRVVCGWRIIVDREVTGAWLVTAASIAPPPPDDVVLPPSDVIAVVICIAYEAGCRLPDVDAIRLGDDNMLRVGWQGPAVAQGATTP